MRRRAWAALLAAAAGCALAAPDAVAPYRVEDDAITRPLASAPGEVERGRQVITGRDGNCLLCHAVRALGRRSMGDLGPPLDGVASRFSAGQLRLRVVDMSRVNPETIMPSYHRAEGLNRVAVPYRGRPVLTAQQVEDTVAFLLTLR